jgi:hypothetical protein
MASISQDLANEDLPFVSHINEATEGLFQTNNQTTREPNANVIRRFFKNMLAINNMLLDYSNQLNSLKIQDKDKLPVLEKENHELKGENQCFGVKIDQLD